MKMFLSLLLIVLMPSVSFADAVIFSGTDVKTLKPNIDLFGNAKILSGAVDPTSVATNAPRGSIYLNTSTGLAYQKTDAGSTTNWNKIARNVMTTSGDTIYGGASGLDTRLAIGTNGQYKKIVSGLPAWGFDTVASVAGATTTTSASRKVLADANLAGFTVTLHTAVGNTGQTILIKKIDSSLLPVTIATTSSQTIDQTTTKVLTLQDQYIEVTSDGTNWKITGFYTAGEVIESGGFSLASTTSGNWGDAGSITVGAGLWMLSGAVNPERNGATFVSAYSGAGTQSGTSGPNYGGSQGFGTLRVSGSTTDNIAIPVGPIQISTTGSSTVIYLKYQTTWTTAAPTIRGHITAARMTF